MADVMMIIGAVGTFLGLFGWAFFRAEQKDSARKVAAMSHAQRQAYMNAAARQMMDSLPAQAQRHTRRGTTDE